MLLPIGQMVGTRVDDDTKTKILNSPGAPTLGQTGSVDIISNILTATWDLSDPNNKYINFYLFHIFKVDHLSYKILNDNVTLSDTLTVTDIVSGTLSLTIDLQNKKITVTGDLTLFVNNSWKKSVTIASW